VQAVVLVKQLHNVLARDGAHVICLDVPQQQADLERVAGSIGGSVLAIDITAADAGEKIKTAAANRAVWILSFTTLVLLVTKLWRI
jgi:NAD(P)-dependent dehydrogenase (short-subunit alcohol dehydrogenase family)